LVSLLFVSDAEIRPEIFSLKPFINTKEAVSQWQFTPAHNKKNEPIDLEVIIEVTFAVHAFPSLADHAK
jgi:hypothetical protein